MNTSVFGLSVPSHIYPLHNQFLQINANANVNRQSPSDEYLLVPTWTELQLLLSIKFFRLSSSSALLTSPEHWTVLTIRLSQISIDHYGPTQSASPGHQTVSRKISDRTALSRHSSTCYTHFSFSRQSASPDHPACALLHEVNLSKLSSQPPAIATDVCSWKHLTFMIRELLPPNKTPSRST